MADKATKRRLIRLIGGAVIAVVLITGFVSFVHIMMGSKSSKPGRQVQIVQIIRPPPPPPDQPPPPPPPKTQESLPKDQPEPTPKDDEPPPSQPLGIDAEGAAGSDAFNLAARSGGSDLIGGTGGAMFAWYTNRIKDAIVERLSSNTKFGSKKFSASVSVWVGSDGRMRGKLVTTTGNRDLDLQIESALSSLAPMSDAPPVEMPQPVTLKIVSHS